MDNSRLSKEESVVPFQKLSNIMMGLDTQPKPQVRKIPYTLKLSLRNNRKFVSSLNICLPDITTALDLKLAESFQTCFLTVSTLEF